MKLARLRHILAVFGKYGFDDLLSRSGIARFLPRRPRPVQTDLEASRRRARNLRLALEELGPTFIKFGQFLSSRPDIFPVEYISEFEKLQDQVPAIPGREALAIVEHELGRPVSEVFAAVSPNAKASASLAQIHPAWTPEGDELVLKIQRPGVRRIIETDIAILYRVADLLDRHSSWAAYYSFVAFIEEFERLILGELDFLKEGQNIERLAANLKYFDHIHLPKVYWPYSTGKVLALERIRGERLSPDTISALPVSRRHLAEELLEAYLKQIVQDGFFHADPHLGNLLFEADGRVGLVDLGVVGNLDADLKFQVGQLLLSFAHQDATKITAAVLEIGAATDGVDIKALEQDIRTITTKYRAVTAADLSIGRAVIDLARVSLAHKLRVPQSFNLLGKTLFYMDVIIKKLCPDLNYIDFIGRSTQRVFANLWQSQYNLARLTEAALETNRLVFDTPGRLNLLLDKLVRNEITIKFEHEHLGGMIKTLHQGANRLSFAIVVGSIIVGSASIMRLNIGREFFGYPLLGIFGFLVAELLGIYLLIRILRTERL